MAIEVRQTIALPQDGTRVDPSTFLESWVSGIEIYRLPVGAFVGGTVQFVFSQSDAPATNERRNGTLWFARGEGRLYVWDQADPSGSLTTQKAWMALSDRRDIWVHNALFTAPQGSPLIPQRSVAASAATEHVFAGFETTTFKSPPPYRPLWGMIAGDPAASNSSFPTSAGEMIFVALESGATDAVFRAVEFGFCNARLGSGATAAGGFAHLPSSAEQPAGTFDNWQSIQTCQSEVNVLIKGIWTSSAPSPAAAQYLRPMYLMPNPPIGVSKNF